MAAPPSWLQLEEALTLEKTPHFLERRAKNKEVTHKLEVKCPPTTDTLVGLRA